MVSNMKYNRNTTINEYKCTLVWSHVKIVERDIDDEYRVFANDEKYDNKKRVKQFCSGTHECIYDGKVVFYTDLVEVAMHWLRYNTLDLNSFIYDIIVKR